MKKRALCPLSGVHLTIKPINVSWIFKNGIDSIPKCKYNLHAKPLQFVKENTNEKRYLRFCVAIAVLLHAKIISKIQLIENKEVTLLI